MKSSIIIIIIIISFIFFSSQSQSLEEVKKNIYYERYEMAKEQLKQMVKSPSVSPDAWYWLGEIYLMQKKIDSAKVELLKGTTDYQTENNSRKKYPLLYIGWAHMLLEKGATEEARQQMEDVLKEGKYKNSVALWAVAKANIDSKNGDAAWAVTLLKKAIKHEKKNAVLYLTLGDAYRKLIDGSNAVVSYNMALELEPSLAAAMYNIGRIYKSQNNESVYMERFNKTYKLDSMYTPVLEDLYYYYFYRDPKKAEKFLNAYIDNADPSPQQAYMQMDILYVTKRYSNAIAAAKQIIALSGDSVKPRLYKLMAYSYAALGDSTTALVNMDLYFEKQKTSELIAKDFELKASLLEKLNPDKSLAIEFYKKALAAENDQKEKVGYFVTLADLQKEQGNRDREAIWRERIYQSKDRPSNLDLYKWGMALYSAEEYFKADSVFAIYAQKYPTQIYGYLWRARSNAMMDSTMESGVAVPHYKKLVEVAQNDSVKNKSVLIKAYGYLGAYEANVSKDYVASLQYFDKILALDPDNNEASKYAGILKSFIAEGKGKQ